MTNIITLLALEGVMLSHVFADNHIWSYEDKYGSILQMLESCDGSSVICSLYSFNGMTFNLSGSVNGWIDKHCIILEYVFSNTRAYQGCVDCNRKQKSCFCCLRKTR